MSKKQLKHSPVPPYVVLFALTHLVAWTALLTFRMNSGVYPFSVFGIGLYGSAVLVSAIGLLYLHRHPTLQTASKLCLLSLPALATLLLFAAIWMRGVPTSIYAPYDPTDSDHVVFGCVLFALLFATVGTIYRSHQYLSVMAAVQLLIYFGTHTLLNKMMYPTADLWGNRPETIPEMLLIYALASFVTLIQQKWFTYKTPSLHVASKMLTIVGALMLCNLIGWFPTNGEYLNWIPTIVPDNAWGINRPLAIIGTVASATWATLPLSLLTRLKRTTHNSIRIFLICLIPFASYSLYWSIGSPHCTLPPIGTVPHDAEKFVAEMVTTYGGLPKESITKLELHADAIYPVDSWVVSNPAVYHSGALMLGSNRYNYDFLIDVKFSDGDEKTLQWSERRSGYTICPFVFDRGLSHPGRFQLIRK